MEFWFFRGNLFGYSNTNRNFVGDALRKVTVSCHQIFLLSLKRGNKSKIDLSFILLIVFSEFKNKTEYAD